VQGRHRIQDAGRRGATEFQLRRDLPDDGAAPAAGQPRAASVGGAIKITARVKYHVTNRISSITTAPKVMQRGIRPAAACTRQLENAAKVIRAVAPGCAVEIARPVHDETAPGPTPAVKAAL